MCSSLIVVANVQIVCECTGIYVYLCSSESILFVSAGNSSNIIKYKLTHVKDDFFY